MDLKNIGDRIRFLRINRTGLSQDGFAKKIDLDRTYLSRVESGKQNLTIETLIKICEVGLDLSLTDFFDFSKIDFFEK